MCGICGFTGAPERRLIDRMTDVMIHRGPNDRGIFQNDHVSFGHRRLSIIDIAGGHQPMFNEDASICIVYNGEIYNHLELRKELESKGHRFQTRCDTEVIIHLYEELGINCVQRLNGMFAFAIWDNHEKLLFLARDRLGIKPLYYAEVNKRFLFASEIKSLLQYHRMPREVNYSSLDKLLTFSFVPGHETMFKAIYKLLPGHVLVQRKGKTRIHRYWKYEHHASKELEEKEIIEQIYELLQDSVRIRLMSDVPLGATLSGGLDSSAVVGMMSKFLNAPVNTFSIGFNEANDELPYARIVARHFRTEHRECILRYSQLEEILHEILWHLEEPITNGANFPTYFYSSAVKENLTVCLIGEGADELFAGYDRFKCMSPLVAWFPSGFKHYGYLYSLGCFTQRQKRALFTDGLSSRVSGSSPLDLYFSYFHNQNSKLDNGIAFDIDNVLPEFQLMRIDKLTMRHSVEARVPFLDFRLVELASKIPSHLKLRSLEEKYILRKALTGFLPEEILKRKKRGLTTPVKSWFERGLSNLVDHFLSEKNIKRRGLFRKDYISYLIKNKNHFVWGRKFRFQILKLVLIELWFNIFIDEKNIDSTSPRW
ncbi:MAG: asparagine synthase (glutamine-hydrolyzing) [Candidatus Hodarchaeota archaeon]